MTGGLCNPLALILTQGMNFHSVRHRATMGRINAPPWTLLRSDRDAPQAIDF